MTAGDPPTNTNSNTGHGHVRARPDGVLARCGGPALCGVCARERASLDGLKSGPPPRNLEIEEWLSRCTRKLIAELTNKGWPMERYEVRIVLNPKVPKEPKVV